MRKFDILQINCELYHHINLMKNRLGLSDRNVRIRLGNSIVDYLRDSLELIDKDNNERPTYLGYPLDIDYDAPLKVAVCIESPAVLLPSDALFTETETE